ncbi:hypothetical protein BDC45DRAFT_519698 [Circinella umbellata]|nr:hypothetical protein BDC45DRAFT_519698 [Circinella umbellata]
MVFILFIMVFLLFIILIFISIITIVIPFIAIITTLIYLVIIILVLFLRFNKNNSIVFFRKIFAMVFFSGDYKHQVVIGINGKFDDLAANKRSFDLFTIIFTTTSKWER